MRAVVSADFSCGGGAEMSDLISKKALKEKLHFMFEWYGRLPCSEEDKCIQRTIKRCMGELDKAPTVDAVKVVWHKVTTRPLTAEEVAYYAEMEMDGIEYVFDCEMPDDGQEILIATKWGTDKDICSNDAEYGIGLEGRGDWDGVYAWAEMPKYEVNE